MNLDFECTPVFEKNFDSTARIIVNRGGTRSSKTYSLAQLFIFYLFTDKGVVSSIVRKTLPALKASAMRDILEILHKHDLYKLVQHNKTEQTITYRNNMIEFFSVDDQQKVRGRKRGRLWCNEANELNYEQEFRQLLLRTTGKIYIDFNPDDENVWINTELEQRRHREKGDVEVIVSSYKDNTFLDEETVKEIEWLEKTDPMFWQIFGLGNYGKITGLIFTNVKIVDAMPKEYRLISNGLDFGFTNDPTALIEVGMQNGELWLNEIIYDRGLTNPDIYEKGKAHVKGNEVIADSAEPKSIEELRRLGWNVHPALKGKDSVKNGIDILKRYPLNITSSSVNLIKERKAYKWAVDKNGISLNVPVDFMNHGWDAVRYVALNKLKLSGNGEYTIF